MKDDREKLDPIIFAVIKARMDGIIQQMAEVILRTSRNPILNLCKDFTCSILTYDARLFTMVNSLPIHLLILGSSLGHIVETYGDDVHPGDCFVNNDPHHGNSHIGDFSMFAPVFHKGQLVCWAASLCHLIDVGAPIETSMNPLAKDVYEEGIHFSAIRICKDHKEVPEITRIIRTNFRYPDQWHGDFLAQVGSLWKGEEEIIKLCEKHGGNVIKQFQDEYLDYGDRRMKEELKKLPRGTWSIEYESEKVEPQCPEGLTLKMKMSIDPDEATVTFDLTDMPDQLEWGLNLSEACARGACIQGFLPSLDPSLPKNDGVFRHFDFHLREGAVVGIPRFPASTATATGNIAEEVAQMVFYLFEQVMPGRGHGAHGSEGATVASLAGTDFRRDGIPYGSTHFFAASGGGASKGCDGWVNQFCVGDGGNLTVSSVELVELAVPQIIWEVRIVTDSAGAGKWRAAPGTYHRIQPRRHTMTIIAFGIGHTDRPLGVAGGKPGTLVDHWAEEHETQKKVRKFRNIGIFEVKEDEDWVCYANGGGGYGDPLERDPELVRDDARNSIVSVEAARDEYGVVLDTKPELYEVDHEATEKLRAQLRRERGTE